MNAPVPAGSLADPQLKLLATTALCPSDTHIQKLRRERFNDDALAELAKSITQVGVLQPIVARPHPKGGKAPALVQYEIVAGERRWLATKLAGVKTIPVNVRELTDEQVLEVQLIENLQREGLHELEEAEGYEELMKLKKINADQVAEMVGKSRSYVYARTKLLALCPEARKAFYLGSEKGGIDASRALLIARIGHHDTQRKALQDVLKGQYGNSDQPMSYREAHRHILTNYMLKLKEAPFDIKDAALVAKVGDCIKCPKRTGNQSDLFGDVKDADVCTDPKCFDDKRQAHYGVARRRLEVAGKKVVAVDTAKKAFPNWDSPNQYARGELRNGFVKLDETTYAGGRSQKVKDLLGEDFTPTLIQHPGSGQIIEVATQQQVAAAAGRKGKARAAAAGTKKAAPKGPDIDDQLLERLVQLIHQKAPKEFKTAHLQVLARRVLEMSGARVDDLEVSAKQRGWGAGAFKAGYSKRIPPQAAKLDARGLTLLMFEIAFHSNRYDRKPVLTMLGINEEHVRGQIIQERKAAQVKARLEGKAKREAAASVKAKGVAKRGAATKGKKK